MNPHKTIDAHSIFSRRGWVLLGAVMAVVGGWACGTPRPPPEQLARIEAQAEQRRLEGQALIARLRQQAEQSNATAQAVLGEQMLIPRAAREQLALFDPRQALHWLQTSAAQGDVYGRFRLGFLRLTGLKGWLGGWADPSVAPDVIQGLDLIAQTAQSVCVIQGAVNVGGPVLIRAADALITLADASIPQERARQIGALAVWNAMRCAESPAASFTMGSRLCEVGYGALTRSPVTVGATGEICRSAIQLALGREAEALKIGQLVRFQEADWAVARQLAAQYRQDALALDRRYPKKPEFVPVLTVPKF